MVHGILDNCGSFERLIPMLKGDYYIVTIDLPSHGLSSHFPAGLPLEFINFVLSIKRVVDHFKWTKFIYVGHSFGGQLGTYFTALYSEYIIKLIVIDTMGPRQVKLNETFDHFKRILNKQMELESKLSNNKVPIYSYESAMDKLMNNRPSKLTKESASILMKRMIKKQEDGFVFTFDQRLKNPPVPSLLFDQQKEIMTNINCPVLYILADENLLRYDTYLKEIFEFNNMKENCEIVKVKGDHCGHQNFPERVSHHVDRFLT